MQAENHDILIILIFSTLSMFSLATFFVYTVYRYQKRIIKKQKELFTAVIQAQESEKQRIAKDLHDQVGPLLSSIKFNISLFDEPNKLTQFKKDNNKLIDIAIDNIRTASYDLLPKVLYDFGLVDALEDSCELLSRGSKIEVIFSCENQLRTELKLTKQIELTIYRIVIEILNNAIKYSKASLIRVQVALLNNYCEIIVKDNGIGFNKDLILADRNTGMGIKNIFSRIDILNGTCNLQTNQSGTTYHIKFKTINLV